MKVTFTETIEVGNYKTGLYRRWTKQAEIEGSVTEVSHLLRNVSTIMKLPGVSARGYGNDNFMIDGFKKMLLLDD